MKLACAPVFICPFTRPVTLNFSGDASVKPGVPLKLHSKRSHEQLSNLIQRLCLLLLYPLQHMWSNDDDVLAGCLIIALHSEVSS